MTLLFSKMVGPVNIPPNNEGEPLSSHSLEAPVLVLLDVCEISTFCYKLWYLGASVASVLRDYFQK